MVSHLAQIVASALNFRHKLSSLVEKKTIERGAKIHLYTDGRAEPDKSGIRHHWMYLRIFSGISVKVY